MNEVAKLLKTEIPPDTKNIEVAPEEKPVCRHLDSAINNALNYATVDIVTHFRGFTSALQWKYGYEKVPEDMKGKYAYSEILGPRGMIKSNKIVSGIVLLAPATTYHYHRHPELTESYLNLCGYFSQNDSAVYPPTAIIYNEPAHPHKITTDETEPLLMTYFWTGSKNAIERSRMIFS